MNTIVAIDPGASGGIVWNDPSGIMYAHKMPETEADVVECLGGLLSIASVVVIERVGGFVRGNPAPGSTMFTFGQNYGLLRGIVLSRYVKLDTVRPQDWQKWMAVGTKSGRETREWKNVLKARAQELFPQVQMIYSPEKVKPTRVTNDIADALLIWEYGRRLHG